MTLGLFDIPASRMVRVVSGGPTFDARLDHATVGVASAAVLKTAR
jgi:hypothetical protein